MTIVNWGVLGLGNMANKFATAIKETKNAKLVSIASHSSNKLRSFSKDYNINKEMAFDDYNKVISNKSVDAIYIATLNHSHFDLIKECINKNKNILCEKPFCLNYQQSTEINELLKKSEINFFEAIAYLSHPQTSLILKLIENEEIGKIKSINLSFGFKVKKINPQSRLFNKNLGGGAILDVGCYPMSFLTLLKKKNGEITFKSIKGEIGSTAVDIHASAKLSINNEIDSEIKVSLKENLPNKINIIGEKGNILINSPWLPEKKTFLEINNGNHYYKQFIKSDLSVYAEQIKNVSDKFLKPSNKNLSLFDIEKSHENMKHLNKWVKGIN